MKKTYNAIIFDFGYKEIDCCFLSEVFDELIKKNIVLILHNYKNVDEFGKDSKILYINDMDVYKQVILLLEGFYSEILHIKVDFNENGIKFFKNNEEILLSQILEYDFLPNLQSVVTSKENYVKDMAVFLKEIEYTRKRIMSKYNKKIKKNFCENYDAYDIFDKITGSIYFKDYEWELLRDSKLKTIFSECENGSFLYLLDTDNSKILRGADTYYYLLANKGKYEDVSLNNINEWNSNNIEFLRKCQKALLGFSIDDYLDKKLILAVLDNLRGYNLQMLNLYTLFLFNSNADDTFCVNITSNPEFSEMVDLINDTNLLMINCLFGTMSLNGLVKLINNVINVYSVKIREINNSNNTSFYNKGLKSHREADSFLENYIAICYYDSFIKKEKNMNIITLLYGGIELPLLFKTISQKNVQSYLMSIKGVYKERHFRSNDNKNSSFECNFYFKNDGYNVLCDDNILTGKTIDLALKILHDNEFSIDEIFVVRHPDMNRIEHIWNSKNFINICLFNSFIKGGLFDGAYTKVRENTNYGGSYLDEFGIFDISKELICRFIYKNGRFSKMSRINEYNSCHYNGGV